MFLDTSFFQTNRDLRKLTSAITPKENIQLKYSSQCHLLNNLILKAFSVVGVGGAGGASAPPKGIREKSLKIRAKSVEIWAKCVKTKNICKIPENLGNLPEHTGEYGAQLGLI